HSTEDRQQRRRRAMDLEGTVDPLLHRPHIGDRLFGIDLLDGGAQLRDELCRIESRFEHDRATAGRLLRRRTIDALLRHWLAEVDGVDGPDHADDANGRTVRTTAADLLADRAASF